MKRISARMWADHFHQFRASGMNAEEYCRKHRLSMERWRHWQSRLDQKPLGDFVPVLASPSESGSLMILQIGRDVKLSFPEGVNLIRLSSLVRALKGALT